MKLLIFILVMAWWIWMMRPVIWPPIDDLKKGSLPDDSNPFGRNEAKPKDGQAPTHNTQPQSQSTKRSVFGILFADIL